jgi:hypothetical protein
MSKDYILRINDNQSLTDGGGSPVSWLSGELTFPESNKMPAPDVFKILTTNRDLDGVEGLDVTVDMDKELYMLPLNYDEGVFFGADYICGRILYGQRELIEQAEKELEAYIIKHTKQNAYPVECNPPVVSVWHLKNNESLLMFHHDTYMDFDIPDAITEKDILNVPCGAFIDDLTAHYMLTTVVYKWLPNSQSDDGETDMEDFEDNDDMPADADTAMYLTFNNGEYSNEQKDLFINLTKTLFCDFMKWHEASPDEAAEQRVEEYAFIARKLNVYTQ